MNSPSAEVVTAGEVGSFRGGSGFPVRFQGRKSGELPFFKVSDMNRPGNELFMVRANNYVGEDARKSMGAVRIPAGAIVFAKVGAAVYLERKRILGQDSCIDNNLAAFVVDDSRYDVRFLHYLLSDFRLSSLVATTALPSLNGTQLRSIPLRVPATLEEQREIARLLSSADALIASLERIIAKKKAMKQGMMQQLLNGRTRLPGFAAEWDSTTLGAVADVKTGPFGSSLHESDYVISGTPIITVEHLAERGIRGQGAPMVSDVDRLRLQGYALRAGDVVFSRVGSIDRNARVSEAEEGWLFSGRLLRVRFDPRRADSKFMSAQFSSPAFIEAVRAVAVGQTMPSLNTAILKGIQIQLPPLREQQAIGAIAEDLNRELDVLERRAKSTKNLRRGMMQELLTGRTRLVPMEVSV